MTGWWLRVLVFAAAAAAGTVLAGWWLLAVLGLGIAAFLPPGDRPATIAATGAALAWLGLLVLAGLQGPVIELGELVAVAMNLPSTALFVLVVAFPALVAGSAAWWLQEVREKLEKVRTQETVQEDRIGISEV